LAHTLSSQFSINAKPAMIDALLKQPLLLAHLWESHQFGPPTRSGCRAM
jgi:hypothetical protein